MNLLDVIRPNRPVYCEVQHGPMQSFGDIGSRVLIGLKLTHSPLIDVHQAADYESRADIRSTEMTTGGISNLPTVFSSRFTFRWTTTQFSQWIATDAAVGKFPRRSNHPIFYASSKRDCAWALRSERLEYWNAGQNLIRN